LNEGFICDWLGDTTVVRNDRVIHVKRENMIKERWHRSFLEEILTTRFPDADYLPTKVNGKFVDYTFYLGNDDFGLEIKNINPEGKSLGFGFTKNEIVARYTNEKFRGLLLSCSGFTGNAKDMLERENVHYAILPYQTTSSTSLKQWVKNKRVTIAFLSKHLNYHDPFKKVQKKAKSCRKSVNPSISINLIQVHFEPYYVETCIDLDHSQPFRTCLASEVHEVESKTGELHLKDIRLDFQERHRSIEEHGLLHPTQGQKKRLGMKLEGGDQFWIIAI